MALKLLQVHQETIAVTLAGTLYSGGYKSDRCSGTVVLLITSSAGSITVSQQAGFTYDGTYYDAVSAANAALGAIATGMTVGTRFISYSPVAAPWSRLKIVEANVEATTVVVNIYEVTETT